MKGRMNTVDMNIVIGTYDGISGAGRAWPPGRPPGTGGAAPPGRLGTAGAGRPVAGGGGGPRLEPPPMLDKEP